MAVVVSFIVCGVTSVGRPIGQSMIEELTLVQEGGYKYSGNCAAIPVSFRMLKFQYRCQA
jgi:hypothetical protein